MTQRLDESEEEMFDLLKLFRQSNPGVGTNITDSAVKRKFLQGISPTLKKGLFVFCNAPLSGTVSRDQLLQYCREAKTYLDIVRDEPIATNTPSAEQAINVASSVTTEPTSTDAIVKAMNELSEQFAKHVETTSQRLRVQEDQINVLSNQSQRTNINYRGGYRSPNRRPPTSRFSGFNSGREPPPTWQMQATNEANPTTIVCFRCGGPNHLARNCLRDNYAPSGNRAGRQ